MLLGSALASLAASAESVPPFAGELPATTAICLWSDDAGGIAGAWQRTRLYQLYASEAMQPFWDEVRRKRGGLLANESLGIQWNELADVCRQHWVLAYDFAQGTAGTLLLADVHGNEAAAVQLLQQVKLRWQEHGWLVESRFERDAAELTGRLDGEVKRRGFVFRGRLCLTDRRDLAERVVAALRGESPPAFASSDVAGKLAAGGWAAPAGALRFYVNPWRVAEQAAASADESAASRVTFYRRHGFAAIEAVTGHLEFAAGSDDLVFAAHVLAEFPLADAAGLLSFKPSHDFQLPRLVPPDAAGVTCFHWDLPAALKAYGFVYDDVYGEQYEGAFEDLLFVLSEDPEGPRVDLRADVVNRLRSKVTRVDLYGGRKTPANPAGRREIWMAESASPQTTTQAVLDFFRGDPDVTSTTVNGIAIWHSRSDRPLLGGVADDPLSYPLDAICVMHGHLVVATDRGLLKQLAAPADRGDAPSATPPAWESKPEEPRIAHSWRDLAQAVRVAHGLIAQNRLESPESWEQWLLWSLLSSETEEGWRIDVDGSRLPPFSTIEPFLGRELSWIAPEPSGWRVQGRLTRPQAPATRPSALPDSD